MYIENFKTSPALSSRRRRTQLIAGVIQGGRQPAHIAVSWVAGLAGATFVARLVAAVQQGDFSHSCGKSSDYYPIHLTAGQRAAESGASLASRQMHRIAIG